MTKLLRKSVILKIDGQQLVKFRKGKNKIVQTSSPYPTIIIYFQALVRRSEQRISPIRFDMHGKSFWFY
jgi:hypothetical protein